jgi:hypothetical protein
VIVDWLIDLLPGAQSLEMVRQEVQVVGIWMQRGYSPFFALISVEAVIVVHGERRHHVLSKNPLYAPRKGGLARTAVSGQSKDEDPSGLQYLAPQRLHHAATKRFHAMPLRLNRQKRRLMYSRRGLRFS